MASGSERVCKRYTDFDIVTLDAPSAELAIGSGQGLKLWQIFAGIAALLVGLLFFRSPREKEEQVDPWQIPTTLSGLSLLQYLRKVETSHHFADPDLLEKLRTEIQSVEANFFAKKATADTDQTELKKIADHWRRVVSE